MSQWETLSSAESTGFFELLDPVTQLRSFVWRISAICCEGEPGLHHCNPTRCDPMLITDC